MRATVPVMVRRQMQGAFTLVKGMGEDVWNIIQPAMRNEVWNIIQPDIRDEIWGYFDNFDWWLAWHHAISRELAYEKLQRRT